jgi:hypothetical protein
MRTRSLTPVHFFRRRQHKPRRIESDDFELGIALRAMHDLTAFDGVVDRDLGIALRTHVAPPRALTTHLA